MLKQGLHVSSNQYIRQLKESFDFVSSVAVCPAADYTVASVNNSTACYI